MGSICSSSTKSWMSIVWLAFGRSWSSSSCPTTTYWPGAISEPRTMRSWGTSSPLASETRRYRMRAPVPSSSWLKRTSFERTAETSFTGTVTSPKEMFPLQMALGTWPTSSPPAGPYSVAGRGGPTHLSDRSPLSPKGTDIEVDGRRLRLSNLDKVLYPDTGFTKGQVVDYYARIGAVMVPHLEDRPVTLVRWPDGV